MVPWRAAASAYKLHRDKETARGTESAGLGMKNKPQKPKGARKGLTRLAPGKEGCSTRQLLVGGAGGFTVKETVWEPVFRSWETQARYQSCHSCLYVKTETCAAFPIQPLWEQKTGGEEDAQVCLSLRC